MLHHEIVCRLLRLFPNFCFSLLPFCQLVRVLVAQLDNLLLQLELLSKLVEQVTSLGHLLVKQSIVKLFFALMLLFYDFRGCRLHNYNLLI